MFRFLLDLVFPPLCLACKQRCQTKFLCPDCWTLCSLPDPIERCRRCFETLDDRVFLCSDCRREKTLPFTRAHVFDQDSPGHFLGLEVPEAMGGFALIHWIQLDWPIPDVIIPMPDRNSLAIARAFAELLNLPVVKAISSHFNLREDYLEEDLTLLIINGANRKEDLEKGATSLSSAFPKRIYALTLFSC